MTTWRRGSMGPFEYEYDEHGHYTGWYRLVDGRLPFGTWPERNSETGETRYR